MKIVEKKNALEKVKYSSLAPGDGCLLWDDDPAEGIYIKTDTLDKAFHPKSGGIVVFPEQDVWKVNCHLVVGAEE